MRVLLFAVGLAILLGCVHEEDEPEPGPTAYGPRTYRGGYQDTRIGRARYVVTFHANRYTSQADVKAMAMRRAYALCKRDGYNDMEVTSEESGAKTTTDTDTRTGAFFGSDSAFSRAHTSSSSSQKFNVALTIRCLSAPMPENESDEPGRPL